MIPSRYSALAFIGLIAGAIAALPLYKLLPDTIQIPPNMFFLTAACSFAGWALGAVIHKLLCGWGHP